MEKIDGYIIPGGLPIHGLQKKYDILYFDGPILSHFIDENGDDYLFYWVDGDNDVNRWIVWRVAKNALYEYLNSGRSLMSLLRKSLDAHRYLVDINRELEYASVHMVKASALPTGYLPEEDSFYNLGIIGAYEDYFYRYGIDLTLKKSAWYIDIQRRNIWEHIVPISKGRELLETIEIAWPAFLETTFFQQFRHLFSDLDLGKRIAAIKKAFPLQFAYAEANSFHVGIAADMSRLQDIEPAYKDWKNTVIERFRRDVIDVDYSSETDMQIIAEKYPDETVRRKIFGPMMKLADDQDFTIAVRTFTNSEPRIINPKPISKKVKEILAPPKLPALTPEPEPTERKFYQAFFEAEVSSNNPDPKITKKAIEGDLFITEIDMLPVRIKTPISYKGQFFHLKRDIIVSVSHVPPSDDYLIESSELGISATSKDKEDAIKLIAEQFIELAMQVKFEINAAEDVRNYIEGIIDLGNL